MPLSGGINDRNDDSLAPVAPADQPQPRRRQRRSYGSVPVGWVAKNYLIEKVSEEVLELEIAGSWAFARCSYAVTLVPRRGRQPVENRGKSVRIVTRQSDGSWKVYLDMWNSDQSPPDAGE